MPEREDGGKNFYADFKDHVHATRIARGASSPTWDDVLIGIAESSPTREVLRSQSVSSSGLMKDVMYSLYFGRPQSINGHQAEWLNGDERVVADLITDLKTFKTANQIMQQPDAQSVAYEFVEFLEEYVDRLAKAQDHPNPRYRRKAKEKALAENVKGFVEQMPRGRNSIDNNLAALHILDEFQKFVQQTGRLAKVEDNPLRYIEEHFPTGGLTPFQLFEMTQEVIDPFLQYILHRNGLVAPEGYEAPTRMPHHVVITHAAEALEYVKTTRDRVVKPTHLIPSLLQDREVMATIIELDKENKLSEKEEPDPFMQMFGISGRQSRNFIKFHAAVREALTPSSNGERFRYRPVISDELKTFLTDVAAVVAEGPEELAEARMFGALIKNPEVVALLVKAGLSKSQLKKWPKALEDVTKKRNEEKEVGAGKKKSDDEFKVDERQLQSLLEEYGSDRTKLALEGKLDPIIGREEELHQMMRILLQRGKSNPLLLGEPGVGKTALFDGLAQYIASGKAPEALIGARVLTLDLSAMNSGAMYRGQFEGRLLPIIQGVAERNARKDKPPIILCIDEVHAALMAGTAEGTPGASELLKPYLTKGELSIIGSTTQAAYAKHIEPDHALDRRFQPVFINQPKPAEAIEILKGLRGQYTAHHKLEVSDELLDLMVRLADRYLPNLQQPDKSINILDAACARAKMAGLSELDRVTVMQTIAAEAKIDPRFLAEDDSRRYLRLVDELPAQVLGQDYATRKIAEALIVAKADLQDPRKPLGSFILLGPTGVGKTETARALSRLLHGTEDALVRVDMSDFQERHEVSKLVGAPPGYVGYGEEGRLTGAVRRKPYSVVVLDEIEKAHPEVLRRFLPVLEEGEIVDGRNQTVSFRNTIIMMTSNLGVVVANQRARAAGLDPHFDPEAWRQATEPVYEEILKNSLPPELINRIDGRFVYHPLSRSIIEQLVLREVAELSSRVQGKWGLPLEITDELRQALANAGYNPEYGARELKRTVKTELSTPLASWLLSQNGAISGRKGEGFIQLGLIDSGVVPQLV